MMTCGIKKMLGNVIRRRDFVKLVGFSFFIHVSVSVAHSANLLPVHKMHIFNSLGNVSNIEIDCESQQTLLCLSSIFGNLSL